MQGCVGEIFCREHIPVIEIIPFVLRGGIAKYELAKSREDIIKELKRVEKTFEEGGFIPHGDHRIPEDVPYDNYKYYVREKLAMMGWKNGDISGVWPLRNFK